MKSQTFQTIKIFWRHSVKYPVTFFAVIVSVIVGEGLGTFMGVIYKDFFDILGTGSKNPAPLIDKLWELAAVFSVMWVFWRIATFSVSYFESSVMRDLYNTCFEYIHGHSYSFFSSNFGGSLVRKVNKYYKAFEEFTDQVLWSLLPTVVSIALITYLLGRSYIWLAVIMLVWIVIYSIYSIMFSRFVLKYDLEKNELDTKTTGQLADTITNNLNIKLFASLPRELFLFKRLTNAWKNSTQRSWNIFNVNEAIQGALMLGLEVGIMYMCVVLYIKGSITIGDFVLVYAFLWKIFERMWNLGRHIRRIYQAFADANEMTEMLLTPHEIQDIQNAGRLRIKQGEIEFKNVGFAYHSGRHVLKDFSLKIESGERLAFVGPSGGGKTTIVKSLLRFMDIQKGSIEVDGQNIAKVTQDSLRAQVSLVPQEPVLFHRTLHENISYGKPNATREEVIHASKLAHCHEFISRLPEKYNTFVGERGIKLSGGERQRVAIARAILANAPILVLDEATSSLDSESEKFIQDALEKLMKGKTVIVIAHRLSTIMKMDRIVVIEGGKIREEGKHEELVKASKGIYQKLWNIQAGGFN